jgi:hypothetical protein
MDRRVFNLPTLDLWLLLVWCAGVAFAGVVLAIVVFSALFDTVSLPTRALIFAFVWGPIAVASFKRGVPAGQELRRRARSARGLCPHCGYDLTANVSGVCPECGSETNE